MDEGRAKGSSRGGPLIFAWRYFRARKTTNAINIISWTSVIAIMIGTISLILVLSVFNGFEDLVKSLYSSFYPELRIGPASGKLMKLTDAQISGLRTTPGVNRLSLVLEEKAFLKNGDYQSPVFLKGVDSFYTAVTGVASHIWKGEFNTGTEERPLLVLGAGIENAVGVQADRNIRPLVVYMPRSGTPNLSDPMSSLSADTLNTSGSFVIQQDFDNKYAITNLGFVKRMLHADADAYGAAELSLLPHADISTLKKNIASMLGKDFTVQDRYQQNAALYSVMGIEKWIIYAILSLILIVASFNMVGALTMLVLEKKEDIATLHALGAQRSFIQKIFLNEGFILGLMGGGSGMLLAFLLGEMQLIFHLIPLQGNSFMIDYFPVKMVPGDFLLVGCTVMVIAVIASWIPARKAALQQKIISAD